jgi:hypothetical protein
MFGATACINSSKLDLLIVETHESFVLAAAGRAMPSVDAAQRPFTVMTASPGDAIPAPALFAAADFPVFADGVWPFPAVVLEDEPAVWAAAIPDATSRIRSNRNILGPFM